MGGDTRRRVDTAEAKRRVLALIRDGAKVHDAMLAVGRKEETYRGWCWKDAQFKADIADTRRALDIEKNTERRAVPGFEEFCRDWLRQPLYPHQLRMLDVIEGREPRDMHPSMTYRPGYKTRILILTPPEHGKTTTWSVNYPVWQIYRNPDVRILNVSQGKTLAKQFLYEIKLKLTSPVYRESQVAFGPEGGFKDPDAPWNTDAIYVRGKNLDDEVQRDPTVQVMGLRGQIYGRREDLVFLDDIVTTVNVNDIAFQQRLIERDIDSRLPPDGGKLVVLGTRVASNDLYKTLADQYDADDRPIWTILRQPAVLDYGDGDSKTWITLWPEKWSGAQLSRKRYAGTWNLIWQQMDADEDMTFSMEAVSACQNRARFPGPSGTGLQGSGATAFLDDSYYRVAGLDPAATGHTAMIVVALDRETGKRFVLDGWNRRNASAADIISQFKAFTETYQLHKWVVERNALQRFIAQLPETRDFARARGCQVVPHYTTASSKYDPDWGVQTMGPLFDAAIEPDEKNNIRKTGKGLIELPSGRQNQWVNDLIEQLTTWTPDPGAMAQSQKTDLVMSLWFTHIACVEQLRRGQKRQTHRPSPFLSPGGKSKQRVINLAELRAAKREQVSA